MPNHQDHRIALLTFNGMQILDVTGPASVFAAANDAVGRAHYEVRILSETGGLVRSNSAIAIASEALDGFAADFFDTVLVVGGDDDATRALATNRTIAAWMRKASEQAQRYGSVCTGTFALASYGLVDGKRVATHWSGCGELARLFPRVEVDTNALYVEDGRVWTSAGVTTGIDMCLEIVSRDLGASVANTIAERLVLYAKRPGYQSQFSPVLRAQTRADAPFSKLIQWMKENLSEVLDVPRLAAWVAMSERNFHRKFTDALGETPARFVETLRLDQVRLLLATRASLKEIAGRTGYSTAAQLSKAFERRFGMTPLLFREMHCAK
ncbi:MAG TPA: GlxA family transcriptional regulator [Burkholderiaceae bacterium]